ncbi:MAG: extracellular solute-binding protein [Anaerolineales bacterium]
MAEEIEFLAWSRTEEGAADLNRSLAAFQAINPNIKISLAIPAPEMMWADIIKVVLYQQGADVGEVGSTYIETLKGMDSLRPFTAGEVLSFGGDNAFVKSVLEAGRDSENQLWAIPWRTDSRVIFYRRDLFAKAGIKEADAFLTPAHMEQTLQALQASGVEMPLALATASPQALATFTACWVWGAGGDYINHRGNAVIFNSPKAQRGFCDYFRLGRYLAPAARKLDITSSDRLFCEGKAAVTYAGTWFPDAIEQIGSPMIKENLGVALPPGVPIVGGTHLVIWKHSIKVSNSLKLIRFLTSKENLLGYPKSIVSPARLDALGSNVFSSSVMYQIFTEAIKKGRSAPSLRLWAVIEDRLGKTLLQIWEKVCSDPDINVGDLIADEMNSLAASLGPTFQSKSTRL